MHFEKNIFYREELVKVVPGYPWAGFNFI